MAKNSLYVKAILGSCARFRSGKGLRSRMLSQSCLRQRRACMLPSARRQVQTTFLLIQLRSQSQSQSQTL